MNIRATADAVDGGWEFHPSGFDGAGFQNVCAVDPFGSGVVLSGCDVGGILRSGNRGDEWAPSNYGIRGYGALTRRVAAICFSETAPGKVYAACGSQGAKLEINGGLFASPDYGRKWELLSTVPQFAGDNTYTAPLPVPHPRSTGNLIALDEEAGLIYMATFKDGLMRSRDGGRTWTTIGLQGKYLRAIALNPSAPDTLYASAYNESVWRVDGARSDHPALERVGPYTVRIEELKFVGDTLYGVGNDNTSGLVCRIAESGAAWEELLRTDGTTIYISVDGYVSGDGKRHVLYVGSVYPARHKSGLCECILKSADSGATWAPLTVDPKRVHYEVGGPEGERWWLSTKNEGVMLGRGGYLASHIVIDPADKEKIYLAGRSGLWRSTNGGLDWYPIVKRLNVTINRVVAADPNVAGRVYVANTDWVFLHSSDCLEHVFQNKPGANTGYGIALDTSKTPARVYEAIGERDRNEWGAVYSNADPASGGAWTDEGLSKATGGKRPLALALWVPGAAPGAGARASADETTAIVAAVDESGIWRKVGDEWTLVNREAMSRPHATRVNSPPVSISWPAGSEMVYLCDREAGVIWRSNDRGGTWAKLWSRMATPELMTFVKADPAKPFRLYVSAPDGVFRLDGADSGTVDSGEIVPVALRAVPNPGPLFIDKQGAVYVTSNDSLDGFAGLYVSRDGGGAFTDVSNDFYKGNAGSPADISVSPDGHIYVATFGCGVIVGRRRHD